MAEQDMEDFKFPDEADPKAEAKQEVDFEIEDDTPPEDRGCVS